MTITAVHQLKNIPRRALDGELNKDIDGALRTYPTGVYSQISCDGWLCCEEIKVDSNEEQIAVTIARIIELALDAGFEQGREYVRNALGVKEKI